MLVTKTYVLVNYAARVSIDINAYSQEIIQAANLIFRKELHDINISESYFTISIKTPNGNIKRGSLINFGKTLARQTPQLCQQAMKIYNSSKHPTSRQLFKAI